MEGRVERNLPTVMCVANRTGDQAGARDRFGSISFIHQKKEQMTYS